MNLHEAAQQALEAIDRALPHAPYHGVFDVLADMADALRAALAEPVQEPVAWLWQHRETGRFRVVMPNERTATDVAAAWDVISPLYTVPPKRKPLTETQIYAAIKGIDSLKAVEVARAVEKAHGIGGGNE